MIIIPMLGRSSRFFKAGYTLPKYQLPLGNETVFARCISSFAAEFLRRPFVFLVRPDFGAEAFVAREIARLGIAEASIRVFAEETRGQAESVMLGLSDLPDDQDFVVFNIDTVRHGFEYPGPDQFGDGFLEVFHAPGERWSFVEPGPDHTVRRTTEKQRISDLCSNGLYGFRRVSDFRRAYRQAFTQAKADEEIYIAPLYNPLIREGLNIRYRLVAAELIEDCGIPAGYEYVRRELVQS